MISLQSLRDKINDFVKSIKDIDKLSVSQDSTIHRLLALISSENFGDHTNKEIDFFSNRYDISSKLFEIYDNKGCKLSARLLSQEGLQIFASLLYLRVLISIHQGASEIHRAKYINVCWKAFDKILLPDFLLAEREQLNIIQDELFKELPVKSLYNKTLNYHPIKNDTQIDFKSYKILPIDILFYEGPIARAYLEMLYSIRCKPRKIIHLIEKRDLVTKKTVGSFLPSFLRYKYAANIQSQKIHHWPQYLFRTQKKLCLKVFEQLQQALKIKQSDLLGAVKLKPLDKYSNNIVKLPIDSLKDPNLLSAITEQNSSMYLFTGGGIMPEGFFNIKDTQFIHIHPGYLPDIRGVDGLLWSTMLTNYPSATCFFMNSGIDTGDIVNAVFLPKITLPKMASQLDNKMIYRLLYSFVDPWIRSVVLRDTLKSTNYLKNITTTHQTIDEGNTFYFMHEKMISKIIKGLLN